LPTLEEEVVAIDGRQVWLLHRGRAAMHFRAQPDDDGAQQPCSFAGDSHFGVHSRTYGGMFWHRFCSDCRYTILLPLDRGVRASLPCTKPGFADARPLALHADRPNSIQHWQLRDLVSCVEDDAGKLQLFTVCGRRTYRFDVQAEKVLWAPCLAC
jgi:hypothetical protein